jgi:acyl carrier protein
MIKRIQDVFSEVLCRDDLNFTKSTKLDEYFRFTSLSFIYLVAALEEEFEVEFPNSALNKFKTVGDIVKFLEKNT